MKKSDFKWSRVIIAALTWVSKFTEYLLAEFLTFLVEFMINHQLISCTKERRWDGTAFDVKQGRSHGEQRVPRNTDWSIRSPVRLTIVSRQKLIHFSFLPLDVILPVGCLYFIQSTVPVRLSWTASQFCRLYCSSKRFFFKALVLWNVQCML